ASLDTISCAGMTTVVSVAPDEHRARATKDHRASSTSRLAETCHWFVDQSAKRRTPTESERRYRVGRQCGQHLCEVGPRPISGAPARGSDHETRSFDPLRLASLPLGSASRVEIAAHRRLVLGGQRLLAVVRRNL